MKIKHFIFSLTLIIYFNCVAQNVTLYVGTFTNEDSKGIYSFQFNTETGELSNKVLATESESPNFITYSPDKKYLYSVNRSADPNKPDYLAAFKINGDGTLILINTQESHGKGPCHISVNESGNKVVVSNYAGGTVSIYPINKNGSLSNASQVFDHNTDTEKSHAHSAQFYKNDLFVADLGRNAIYQYKLKNSSYELEAPSIIKTTGNPGPRHFTMSKNNNYFYIINELGSSITSVKRTNKGFIQIDEDPTLDYSYKGKNSCADIHLSKDERFLYGSNRGENSIAVFKRDTKKGTIGKIQTMPVHGNWPRNFTLDPSGKFLLVANRKSHNISVFTIDSISGKLSFLNSTELPSPVCLLF